MLMESRKSRRDAQDAIEADVVVVGGGGAGLAAAIKARELGRNVVLIEKNARLGGSTAWSVGSVTATNTPHQLRLGIKDRPDDHFEDMGLFCERLGLPDNESLRRLLIDNVTDTFRWLIESGVEFLGPLPEPPHRKPRMHNVLPNSRAFIFHLEKRARRSGVDIRTGIAARELLVEDGAVRGVLCEANGRPLALRAEGAVVLATGDFSGNREMRVKHLADEVADAEPINPTNTGDGHLMVEKLGGRIVHPHFHLAGIRFQAPSASLISRIPPYRFVTRSMNLAMRHLPDWLLRPFVMSFLTTVLLPSPQLYKSGALLINRDGRRFSREGLDAAAAIAGQPGQIAYILLDDRLVKTFSGWPNFVSTAPGVAYAYMDDYRRNRRDIFHRGATLADLARKLGMPPAALAQSVAEYNASVERGEARGRRKMGEGPFVMLGPVRLFINFTDSGVAVNERLEVLGDNDVPIPGLYAAGFVGMGGMLLEGHGHHLAWAFTSGRIAGRHAAFGAVTNDLPGEEAHSYRVEEDAEE